MQIKQYLDDKAVAKGDKLFSNQGETYEFVNFEGGLLTAISSANLTVRMTPADLGCYVQLENRTEVSPIMKVLRPLWLDAYRQTDPLQDPWFHSAGTISIKG